MNSSITSLRSKPFLSNSFKVIKTTVRVPAFFNAVLNKGSNSSYETLSESAITYTFDFSRFSSGKLVYFFPNF